MRLWARPKSIAECLVESNGKPIVSLKAGFKSEVRLAKLGGKVTPHIDVAGCRLSRHVSRGALGNLRAPIPAFFTAQQMP